MKEMFSFLMYRLKARDRMIKYTTGWVNHVTIWKEQKGLKSHRILRMRTRKERPTYISQRKMLKLMKNSGNTLVENLIK